MSAPGMTAGLAAGISKYRHSAPIRKLRTNPIKILVIAKLLRADLRAYQLADRHLDFAGQGAGPGAMARDELGYVHSSRAPVRRRRGDPRVQCRRSRVRASLPVVRYLGAAVSRSYIIWSPGVPPAARTALRGLRRLCFLCALPKNPSAHIREGIARVQCPHLHGN